MGANERGQMSSDLVRGRARFQAWRERRSVGERIPQPLWALAVELTKTHGVSRTAAALGLDTSPHRSHQLVLENLAESDLILAMAREHLRSIVVAEPSVFPRTFTLKELVRRGTRVGPRRSGEELAGWLARAGAGRERTDLLGASRDDDVADPIGGPQSGYDAMAALLAELVERLVGLAWGILKMV